MNYRQQSIQRSEVSGLDDVYELPGRNLSGTYLHVILRVLPDRRLRVFHINTMTEAQRKRYRRYSK
jgi:hypothetical protein